MKKQFQLFIFFLLAFVEVYAQTPVVSTYASSGFSSPQGIVSDNVGNIYVADETKNQIIKVNSSGTATIFAGNSLGTSGSSDGVGTSASFLNPTGITIDKSNSFLYVTDKGNHTIRKITISSALVTTLAGIQGTYGAMNSTLSASKFFSPSGITIDINGDLYITEVGNHLIRKISISTNQVSTIAGITNSVGSQNGAALSSKFNIPTGIAISATGDIYIADSGNQLIRKISNNTVSTFAGIDGNQGSLDGIGLSATFYTPYGIIINQYGDIFITEKNSHIIRRIDQKTNVTRIAGVVNSPALANGNALTAQFKIPAGICSDLSGNLFISDAGNLKIRKITFPIPSIVTSPSPITGMSTVAGTPSISINVPFSTSNLSGNIIINAPTKYEISEVASGPFSQSITIAPSVSNYFIRIAASAPVGQIPKDSISFQTIGYLKNNASYIAPGAVASLNKKVTWDGGGADNNWKTATNWVGDIAPVAGDTLVFDGSNKLSNINNFPSGTSFAGIGFKPSAGAFNISGNDLILSGGAFALASNISSDSITINNKISFTGANSTITSLSTSKLIINGTINNNGNLVIANSDGSIKINGIISGTGRLDKIGTGSLTLKEANTFTGGVNLKTGTLILGNANCLGDVAGIFTIENGTTIDNITGIGTIANNPMVWNGSFTYSGTASGAVLNLGTGAVTLNNNITITTKKLLTVGGIISGPYNIIHTGSGTNLLRLSSSSNNFTGSYSEQSDGSCYITSLANVGAGSSSLGAPTTVANGTISLGSSTYSTSLVFENVGSFSTDRIIDITSTTGAVFLTNNKSNTYSVSFISDIAASINGSKTLFFAGSNKQNNIISGKIPNPATGTIGIYKSGVGKWILTGNNTFTGTTTISQGVLQIGNGGTTGSIAGGNISINDTLIIDKSNLTTLSGTISGAGKLIKKSAGKLILTANNTFTGPITMNQGVLQLGNGGATGEVASASILINDSLIVDRSNAINLTSIISGTGKLIKKSAGILKLSGVNTYAGSTVITNGTVELGITNAVSVSSIVLNGGVLSTGSSTGFSNTTAGTLALSATSSISLGSGNHTLTFAESNAVAWTANTRLNIIGWQGGYNGTTALPTGPKIMFGTTANGLTASQLTQIFFLNTSNGKFYTATQLVSGEIVPLTIETTGPRKATWDGGGADNNWSTAANWDYDIAPITGDTLLFTGTYKLVTNNNFAAGTSFAAIIFDQSAGGFTLNGNAINLTAEKAIITDNTIDSMIINTNLNFISPHTILTTNNSKLVINATINIVIGADSLLINSAGTTIINGVISGNGYLVKDGSGSVVLVANNNYTGLTTLIAGTLQLGNGGITGIVTSNGIYTKGSVDKTLIFKRSDDLTFSKKIAGSLNLIKKGTGKLTLTGINSISGKTVLSEGTLDLGSSSQLNTFQSSSIEMNGATLTTGQSTGFSITSTFPLILTENSLIALGTNNHMLKFGKSSTTIWTSGKRLLITGWQGGFDGTTAGSLNPKVNVGNTASDLTSSQLAQIFFLNSVNSQYYTATQLATGEVVPRNVLANFNPNIYSKQVLIQFNTTVNTPSSPQTIKVGGTFLTNDIIISAPTNFEISNDNGANYKNSINLIPVGGIVDTTNILIRLIAIKTAINIPTGSNVNIASIGVLSAIDIAIPASQVTSGATITQQPNDVTTCVGKSTTFQVIASGATSFKWQVKTQSASNFVDISNPSIYSGENTATLTIKTSTISMNNDEYRCIVDGIINSNPAKLLLKTIPIATFSYGSNTICKASPNPVAILGAGASAGTFTASNASLMFISNLSGEINLTNTPSGNYTITNNITAANGCDAVTYNTPITISDSPNATLSILGQADKTIEICDTDQKQIWLNISGSKPITIYTSVNGIEKDTVISGPLNNFKFRVSPNVTTEYKILSIKDNVCTTPINLSETIKINVKPSNGRNTKPLIDRSGTYTNCNNNTLVLQVSNLESGATYQWYRDGRMIVGANNDTISLATYGKYTLNDETCYPSDTADILASSFDSLPIITPNNIGLSSANLSTSSSNVRYQWYINDYLILGDTNSTLNISFNGKYKLGIKNTAGCTIFSEAYIVNDTRYPNARAAIQFNSDSSVTLKHDLLNGYNIVPNPSTDVIHVVGNNMTLNYKIIIKNIEGNTIYEYENILSNHNEHNISSFPTGLYIVELIVDNTSYFSKLVKD
jgi:autotransporter-associated beta strand protein